MTLSDIRRNQIKHTVFCMLYKMLKSSFRTLFFKILSPLVVLDMILFSGSKNRFTIKESKI